MQKNPPQSGGSLFVCLFACFVCVCGVNKNGAGILTSQSPLKNTKFTEISVCLI